MPATVGEPNNGCSAGLQSRLLVRQQRAMMGSGNSVFPVAYATCLHVAGGADAQGRYQPSMRITSLRASHDRKYKNPGGGRGLSMQHT